jgi:hypothetical protein
MCNKIDYKVMEKIKKVDNRDGTARVLDPTALTRIAALFP